MKKAWSVFLLITIVFTLTACTNDTVKGSVVGELTNGNAELDVMPQKLLEQVNIGETVVVTVGDFSAEMPFVEELIAEDGKLQLFFDKEDWNINICLYNERFCQTYEIGAGEKVEIRKK